MKRYLLPMIMVLAGASSSMAQVTVQPSLGLHTINFNGDYPARAPISPGNDHNLRLGGGLAGPQNGARLQLELFDPERDLLRIPISVEYHGFRGVTTFSATSGGATRRQRLTITHTADMISFGAGLKASFTELPSVYVLLEGKANYIYPAEQDTRLYFLDNNETERQNRNQVAPEFFRLGAYVQVGAQVDFFEPTLLDFNVGYGAINLGLKETDPEEQRNLLVVENFFNDPETTLGYLSIGMSVVWQL